MNAIILLRRDAREFDCVVSIYTRFSGKQQVLARGTKKMVSKQSTQLEPLTFVDIEIMPGKEIDHVIGVQLHNFFPSIHLSIEKRVVAIYALALVEKLTKIGESDERLFHLIFSWLHALEISDYSASIFLDWFIFHFSFLLGFAPVLDNCALCNTEIVDCIFWSPEHGGIICKPCHAKILASSSMSCSFVDIGFIRQFLHTKISEIAFVLMTKQQEYKVQSLLFAFLQHHTEMKLLDWRKLANFS